MGIFEFFKHLNLSPGQEEALHKLEAFLLGQEHVFMLKGYAGSGKTTILDGLVNYLHKSQKKYALMAPTGRASKVIREKTGREAYTIHKSIYSLKEMVEISEGDSFYYYFKLRNYEGVHGTIFIIDEASMVSDAKSQGEFFRFGSGYLLSDLITYSRISDKSANTKLIFVGDPCQLAPVNDSHSKALDADYLKEKFKLTTVETELKEVIRQNNQSGILEAASKIRKSISAGFFNDFNLKQNGKDIFNPAYENFLGNWQNAEGTKIIIASKNKTSLDLNLQIRELLFGVMNLPVQKGEIVIVGANNQSKGIFNGEFAVVNDVSDSITQRVIYLRGKPPVTLTWRDVELVFPDGEKDNNVAKGKLLENFLYGDNYLKPEETQALYVDFTSRNKGLKPGSPEFIDAIIKDEYFNCLMIKYGYAVTCHKAQGGEWDNVFSVWDMSNAANFNYGTESQKKEGKTNEDFYRWAYTAITRASKRLYALNPPYFNSYSSMAFIDNQVIDALNELSGSQVQSEEVALDTELLELLNKLHLANEPVQIQDHAIRVIHAVQKHGIEVSGWQKLGFEIRYSFKRNADTALFRTYINGQNEFRKPVTVMPNSSPKGVFNSEIEEILKRLPNLTVKRNTAETIICKTEFDIETEERFPFTKYLFDDLIKLTSAKGIILAESEHLQYKERHSFKRNGETAVLDFEYNKNGFFGRVVPIPSMTNSPLLLADLHKIVRILKEEENAS